MIQESIPKYIYQIPEMKEMMDAEQGEIDRLEERIRETEKQFTVMEADTALYRHEKDYGLSRMPGEGMQQRRRAVSAKRNMQQTATLKAVETMVQVLLNANQVTAVEHPEDYSATIYVGTDYLLTDMEKAKRMLWEFRPAHIKLDYINSLNREHQTQQFLAAASTLIIDHGMGEAI